MKKFILVTGDSPDSPARTAFKPIVRSKKYTFESISWDEWNSTNKGANGHFFYLDISQFTDTEINQLLKNAESLGSLWGIVDTKSRIKDVGSLFHRGCCDYIDTNRLDSVKVKRLKQVTDFHAQRAGSTAQAHAHPIAYGQALVPASQTTPSPQGKCAKYSAEFSKEWNNVIPGREYVFCFMYIELLPSKEWSKKAGDSHKEQMQNAFHDMIDTHTSAYNGKIWMWNEWGGVVLFPFDGKKCEAAVCATRLLLNRVILSIEGGPFHALIDYKIALHVGTSSYKERGKTGTIVSDDVNFIFHLGAKYAEPNRLYITSRVYNSIQSNLYTLFAPQGEFEEHPILRLDSPFPH